MGEVAHLMSDLIKLSCFLKLILTLLCTMRPCDLGWSCLGYLFVYGGPSMFLGLLLIGEVILKKYALCLSIVW